MAKRKFKEEHYRAFWSILTECYTEQEKQEFEEIAKAKVSEETKAAFDAKLKELGINPNPENPETPDKNK